MYFILFISFFQYFGCSITSSIFNEKPQVVIKKDFDGNGIAVLTFAKQGTSLPNNIGKQTADKLTDALFLKGGYNVVDRSKVNSAQSELEIENVEFLSSDQIQQLGLKLKANYIILGRVQSISEQEYFNVKTEQEISISFRVISVKDTDVVGVANYKKEIDDKIPNDLDEMLKDMISRMSPE